MSWRVKCDWRLLYSSLCECGEFGCNCECQCDCCNMKHEHNKFETLFEVTFGLSIAEGNKYTALYERNLRTIITVLGFDTVIVKPYLFTEISLM